MRKSGENETAQHSEIEPGIFEKNQVGKGVNNNRQ
jgi:hypothetical protein